MRFVGGVRKEMGIRTLFNILGPLANPAGATMQLLGVYSEPLAHVLKNLGVKRAMVVYGTDSIDEISLSAPTKVCEFKGDEFKSYEITPEQFGLKRCKKEEPLLSLVSYFQSFLMVECRIGIHSQHATAQEGFILVR
jgi:anthranilate phosphoribosyltransferase